MRKLKKLSAILLTGVLTFSAVACGNSTGNHAKTESGASVQERIASVQTKMQEVKSLEMSMDMDMALKATEDGESFDFTMKTSGRSEEHTSELQSRFDLVCRLLLEKKKKKDMRNMQEENKKPRTEQHRTSARSQLENDCTEEQCASIT